MGMKNPFSLRHAISAVLFFSLVGVSSVSAEGVFGRIFRKPEAPPVKLQPGQFEWHPERSPNGPLLVVCSIDDQMLYDYRNGVEIDRSTISTGREGKETPTGVFSIL